MPLGNKDLAQERRTASHISDVRPTNLREVRDALGLSREQVAKALGIDPSTLQRWEMPADAKHRRRISAEDRDRLLGYYDQVNRERHSETVPRGTVNEPVRVFISHPSTAEEAIRRVRAIAARLEADLHEWGAGRSTFDAMKIALATEDTVRMFKDGFAERKRDIPAAFENYERFVEALRLTLKDRIEILHEPPAGSESE